MKYVIGVDLGTSAVKLLLMDENGVVTQEVSKPLSLIQLQTGYSEQDPDVWVAQTMAGLSELVAEFKGDPADIEGLSFSGQMHGLVLLDENNDVLRNAILWNDTRTTEKCQEIYDTVGEQRLLEITKNPALEGFTLPKILWVKKYEPEIFARAAKFVLPKDYVRYKLTGELHMEYSDAAGTLLLDVGARNWSEEMCRLMAVDADMCPPLVSSYDHVGRVAPDVAEATELSGETRVFAGGADNACGAIGAGILKDGKTLVSTGTSGVVLSYEAASDKDFNGQVHYFNHGAPDAYYTMGVTLAAGYSLSWFRDVFAGDESFEDLLADVDSVPIGSNGLLFTPYVAGERTPHADATIRGSFIGMDSSHRQRDFVRAVMEGITFSLNESIDIFRKNGKKIDEVVSIGGGAKNDVWLQMQSDVFDARIVKLSSEQGPGMGAAMLAAYGCGWFDSLKSCADAVLQVNQTFEPDRANVARYRELFNIYQDVYGQTMELNNRLVNFRN